VLGAGLLLFVIDQTDPALSAFKSAKAVAIMVAIGVAWIAGRFLLGRFAPWPLARTAVFAAGAAGVLALVVLPTYDDETVVETLGISRAPTAVDPTAPSGSAGNPPVTTVAPQPVRIRTGSFRGVDHRASGAVNVYRRPDGTFTIGLEDIDIQPGPDYDVYLVPGSDRTSRAEGAVHIDDLRGNKGTQYYDVPASADLSRGAWTVLVWCQTFGVPVASATVNAL
jgi:electron transfer DM13